MLGKSNKNRGMSLIEVIVSMLVLSIAVVAVTMSFSAASKMNRGTRQKQEVASLMENLMEYTEAGGTDYGGWFSASAIVPQPTTDPNQEKTLYKGVAQGLYVYDVRVLVDKDPDEYEQDKLNDYDVIQFGGESSNTIMIDASLKSFDISNEDFGDDVSDYDEAAYKQFSNQHTTAVLEANIAGATPPLVPTDMADIPNFVDRELRLVVTTPETDKMQLTAYLTYILDSSILLPDSASHTYQTTLFESIVYDAASVTDGNTLDQIYIMYSPAKLESVGYGKGQDIRIMDPAHALDANIFIANQQTGTASDVMDAIGLDSITARDTSTHTVFVSCSNPDPALGAGMMNPAGGDIYCSGYLALQDFDSMVTTGYQQKLVAKGEEVRIVTTTLEILEAGTDKVLAHKKVTHLQ